MKLGSARTAAVALGVASLGFLRVASAHAAEPPAGTDGAARILAHMAAAAQGERVTRAWVSLGSGAVLTTAGLLDEADGDAGFSRVVWIAGLLSIAGGALGLVVQTPLERLEEEAGAGSAGYSPSRLQERWREQAEEARTARTVISVVHFVIGGAGLAASGALVAGLGDWGERKRESWAVQLFAGGTIFTSAGIATLLLPSDAERGYELAYPARPSSGLTLHFAPVRGGATLQFGGAF
jgi:hypothetical protein